MSDASILQNYPGSKIQFTNRLGQPAPIDVSTKPVRVEFDDPAQAVLEILNIAATGNKGEFSCDVNTLAVGGVTGAIVADRDMTPAGEDELRVPFGLAVVDGPATGAGLTLGAGVDK